MLGSIIVDDEIMKYYFYKCAFALLAALPWGVLSWLSRAIAWLLCHVVQYRREVVRGNLKRSFPKRTPREIEVIARDFYEHLVFQFLASPKLLAQDEATLKSRHLQVSNLEVCAKLREQGYPVFLILMGHCGNWELFSAGQIYFSDLGIQQEQLYRPLKDRALDRVQREMRSAHGALCTPKAEIGRRLVGLMRQELPETRAIAFIADQTPGRDGRVGLWEEFLGQPTAFLDGAERIARKYGLPVVYLDIERRSNICYVGRFKLLSLDPQHQPLHELTRQYIRELEQTIERDPAAWLWSHRRWKHQPPQTFTSQFL